MTRIEILERLAEMWREEVELGTTQGGGRRYREHANLHAEAIQLLAELDDAEAV
jgi:hypothetical protein